jgi:hypothetical protein
VLIIRVKDVEVIDLEGIGAVEVSSGSACRAAER